MKMRLTAIKASLFAVAMTNAAYAQNVALQAIAGNSTSLKQCDIIPYLYCCDVSTKCCCSLPPTAPGQCSEASWVYCCTIGKKCICPGCKSDEQNADSNGTSLITANGESQSASGINASTIEEYAVAFMCVAIAAMVFAVCWSCIRQRPFQWSQPDVIDSNVLSYKRYYNN